MENDRPRIQSDYLNEEYSRSAEDTELFEELEKHKIGTYGLSKPVRKITRAKITYDNKD